MPATCRVAMSPQAKAHDSLQSRVAQKIREGKDQEANILHYQPLGFTKKLLSNKESRHLKCSVDEVNTFLCNNLSDPVREQELGHSKASISPAPPMTEFNTKEPHWKGVQEVVKAANSTSAPEPSGVSYSMYKHCPRLLQQLQKVLRVIWQRGRVSTSRDVLRVFGSPRRRAPKTLNSLEPSHYSA